MLWLAVLASNIGTWMQTVGAQWLLVGLPNAATLVALVQTADTLPDVLLALPAGALADTFDRRRVLIGLQLFQVGVGAALTALTISGRMTAPLLLAFTFALGAGSAMALPPYQALIPELVPRDQLTAASSLGGISINLARAIGPAIAGLLIARVGFAAVFALNTATFLFLILVLVVWRRPIETAEQSPERFIPALRAGGRYIRYSPVVRRILFRLALFAVPATAVWALLPVVASQRLGLGAQGYGLLLGALGGGAVTGAFTLPRFGARLSSNRMIFAASVAYAVPMAILVLVRNPVVAFLALIPAGAAWVVVIANVNAWVQLFLPGWVRARGLAVYQIVLFGSQAVAALGWGLIAEHSGLVATFLLAGRNTAGRRGNDTAMAAARCPWAQPGSIHPLAGTDPGHRSRARHWSRPDHHDLYSGRQPGRAVPEVDARASPLALEHGGDSLGALPRWGGAQPFC